MLHELVVKNLGVIEEASLLLGPGLTALTGETGAGKTLVTEAISLLAGGRSDSSLVRPGADEATIEGRFVKPDGDELIVSRVVPSEGRTRAYVGGHLASVSALGTAVGPQVEIHGQHGHQRLLKPTARRAMVDHFGRHDTSILADAKKARNDVEQELQALGGDETAQHRDIDLLKFQLDEINSAVIVDAEEDHRLAAQELLLGDAHGHIEAAASALQLVSADGDLGTALHKAIGFVRDNEPFAAISERLMAVQADLSDIGDMLRAKVESIDDDPGRLDEVQSRRAVLSSLRRKYGSDLASVIDFRQDAEAQLDRLIGRQARVAQLVADLDKLGQAEVAAARALGAQRSATAKRLVTEVVDELRQLSLPNAQLDVAVRGDDGADIEFMVAMNPGSPLLPVTKVASGGELSRIMLALQLVVGLGTDTVIYDEVDTGVAGKAATSIGRALARVSETRQVLVVTHLPQVAAFASRQISITKSSTGSDTRTELAELDRDGRVIELARMLSGSPSSHNARAHAEELLDSVRA